jgi:hypothetical protein
LGQRRHGGVVRTPAVGDRGQCTWRDERKWRQKANVPFHLAFTLRDLGERLNTAQCDIVEPQRYSIGDAFTQLTVVRRS